MPERDTWNYLTIHHQDKDPGDLSKQRRRASRPAAATPERAREAIQKTTAHDELASVEGDAVDKLMTLRGTEL